MTARQHGVDMAPPLWDNRPPAEPWGLGCQGGRETMQRIFKQGAIEIWAVTESWGTDYWVYGVASDPRVCPSLGMANEVAAG